MKLMSLFSSMGAAALALSVSTASGTLQDTGQGEAPAQVPVESEPDEDRVVWDFTRESGRFSEVLRSGDIVYALDRSGRIDAIDASEGSPLWSTEGKESMSHCFGLAAATIEGIAAVVVSCDTALFALDSRNGEEIWRTEMALGADGPAVAQGIVVSASSDGFVYGCDVEDGSILWRQSYMEDAPAEDPPGFDGDRARFKGRPARPTEAATDGKIAVFSVFDQCRAIAVDVKTGARLWDVQTEGWCGPRPTIGQHCVFVGSQDKHVYAVDKASGELRWKFATGARISASAAVQGDTVYFGSCDRHFYAVSVETGERRWAYNFKPEPNTSSSIYARPVIAKDTAYFATMGGKVYAVDREKGELRWETKPIGGSEINSDLVTNGELLMMTTRRVTDGKGESVVIAVKR